MTATWTATVNRNVGDTGSSSDINTYIGVNGNLDYLKGYTDATRTVTQADVTGSRALDTSNNHIYQNTSGKIIIVAVTVTGTSLNSVALCKVSSPPDVVMGQVVGGASLQVLMMTFVVPVNYYYKVTNGANAYLESWIEWTLF